MANSTLAHSALLVSAICTALSCFFSMLTMAGHLVQTRHRALKAYTIRIILMVPVYSIETLGAMLVPEAAVVLAVFRSAYEAFALFSFVQLMLAYLSVMSPSQGHGATGVIWIAFDMTSDSSTKHLPPLCCLEPWPSGPVFLRRVLCGVFQYTFLMPFVTLLTGLTQAFGSYGQSGDFGNLNSAYPWLTLIQNASQCWALYCLVLFYNATASRLHGVRPLAKFLGIKMVVFFTWWQDLCIAAAVFYHLIPAVDANGDGERTVEEAGTLLSNVIVSLEMLVMSGVFAFAFPPADYEIDISNTAGSVRYVRHRPQHQGNVSTAASLTSSLIESNDDFETSPWDLTLSDNRQVQREVGGVTSERVAADLAKSVAFFDVLSDIRVMARLGRDGDGNHGDSSQSSVMKLVVGTASSSVESRVDDRRPTKSGAVLQQAPPTFQERLFGRRRLRDLPLETDERENGSGAESRASGERTDSASLGANAADSDHGLTEDTDDDDEEEINFEV